MDQDSFNSIDCYWNHEMSEQELINYSKQVIQNYNEMLYKENDFMAVM